MTPTWKERTTETVLFAGMCAYGRETNSVCGSRVFMNETSWPVLICLLMFRILMLLKTLRVEYLMHFKSVESQSPHVSGSSEIQVLLSSPVYGRELLRVVLSPVDFELLQRVMFIPNRSINCDMAIIQVNNTPTYSGKGFVPSHLKTTRVLRETDLIVFNHSQVTPEVALTHLTCTPPQRDNFKPRQIYHASTRGSPWAHYAIEEWDQQNGFPLNRSTFLIENLLNILFSVL
ncbi:hypothetical protein TNCV_3357931 [Trichonephila clavipes]|nr:hypothetical protein TNCV_3357931 [Trichonephila clavipes]